MTDIKATLAELNGALDLVLQERDGLRDDLIRVRGAFNDNKNQRVAAERERDELRESLSRARSAHGTAQGKAQETIDKLTLERNAARAELANVTRGKQAADLALTAQTANYEREKTDNALLRQLLEEAWRFDIGTRLKRDIKAVLDSVPAFGPACGGSEVQRLTALLEQKETVQAELNTTLENVLSEGDRLRGLLEEAYRDGWNGGCESQEQRYQNTARTSTEGWELFRKENRIELTPEGGSSPEFQAKQIETQARNILRTLDDLEVANGEVERLRTDLATADGDVTRAVTEANELRAQVARAELVVGAAAEVDRQAFAVGSSQIDIGVFRGLRVHLEQYAKYRNGLANAPAHEDPRDELLRVCWRAMFGGEYANPLRERMKPYAPVAFDESPKPVCDGCKGKGVRLKAGFVGVTEPCHKCQIGEWRSA